MATTIGRVDFIVDLDGKKLPGQARALGDKIGAAGTEGGKKFSKNFETEFDKSMTSMARHAANELNKTGDLAGESFTKSFEKSISRRAKNIQGALADTLSDNTKLKEHLSGFDDLSEGVAHYEEELNRLNKVQALQEDSLGRVSLRTVLAKDEAKKHMVVVKEMAGVIADERVEEEKRVKILDEAAKAQEALSDEIHRMNTLSKDSSALRQAANKQDRDYAAVARTMRTEMEGLAAAQQVSNRELTTFSDNLERTVEKLKKEDDAIAKSAADKVAADEKRIASEKKVEKAQKDRVDAAKKLDAAQADIDRRMGNLTVYKEYIKQVGGAEEANKRLRLSFMDLGDLGGSERSIAGLENRIKSYNDTLEKSRGKAGDWAKELKNPLSGVTDSWKRMDGTVKLVVASILGAGDQVAVLGSALGAGIVAVGGAVASLAVGAVAGIGIIKSLTQDIEKAPAAMRPTIQSFKDLGKAFGDVNAEASQAAFNEIGDSFSDLNGVVRKLEPSLEGVYKVLGKAIRGFADFSQSAEGMSLFQNTIRNAEKNLETFTGTLGTFGGALLRAFEGAQPLIEDMFNWVDRLANQFDAFTKSTDFAVWISNAQQVWGAFGGTLDAVSKALHDLVTPEAVERTTALLDNLTRLAPGLGEILNTIGSLDPFGLLVDIIADLTDAFIGIAPAATNFAIALNGIIQAVPAPVWVATATAIGIFVAAFAAIKTVSAIGGMFDTVITSLGKLTGGLDETTGKVKGFKGAMGVLGKAGVVGAAVAGFIGLVTVTQEWARELAGIDGIVKKAVKGNQTLLGTIDALSLNIPVLSQDFKDTDKALEGLSAWSGGNLFAGIGQGLSTASTDAMQLFKALGELDKGIKDLPLEDQTAKFSGWAKELGATDDQVLDMIDSMPEFKKTLEDAALAEDGQADQADILRIALQRATPAMEGTTEAAIGLEGGLEGATQMADLQSDAMERLSGKTLEALDAVDGVADGIKTLGSVTREQRSAARDYEAALDDLATSIEENGTSLDITTEAGRNNQSALDDMAQATLDLAGETYNLTGNQDLATQAIANGRQALIDQLAQFGITGPEAEAYADSLGLIPTDVETVISANTEAGTEMADAFAHRLYELGLIEVDPTVDLNTAPAEEAAAAIDTHLSKFQTSAYTATLDAQGELAYTAIDEAKTKVYEFESAPSTVTLDANGEPAMTVLTETGLRLDNFSTKKTVTTLDADNDNFMDTLNATTGSLSQFATKKTVTTLDANGDPAGAVIEKTARGLDTLHNKKTVPKIDADPSQANTKLEKTTTDFNNFDKKSFTAKLDVNTGDAVRKTQNVQDEIDAVKGKTVYINVYTNYIGKAPDTATGGMFFGAQVRRIAEAGPEAVVPLRRPLAQVDPAVRALSAFAQGLPLPGTQQGSNGGRGGSTGEGNGRTINIQPGAIVVNGAADPRRTAVDVVNRITERAVR